MCIAVRYCECFVPIFLQSLFSKTREQFIMCTCWYYGILLLFGFILNPWCTATLVGNLGRYFIFSLLVLLYLYMCCFFLLTLLLFYNHQSAATLGRNLRCLFHSFCCYFLVSGVQLL